MNLHELLKKSQDIPSAILIEARQNSRRVISKYGPNFPDELADEFAKTHWTVEALQYCPQKLSASVLHDCALKHPQTAIKFASGIMPKDLLKRLSLIFPGQALEYASKWLDSDVLWECAQTTTGPALQFAKAYFLSEQLEVLAEIDKKAALSFLADSLSSEKIEKYAAEFPEHALSVCTDRLSESQIAELATRFPKEAIENADKLPAQIRNSIISDNLELALEINPGLISQETLIQWLNRILDSVDKKREAREKQSVEEWREWLSRYFENEDEEDPDEALVRRILKSSAHRLPQNLFEQCAKANLQAAIEYCANRLPGDMLNSAINSHWNETLQFAGAQISQRDLIQLSERNLQMAIRFAADYLPQHVFKRYIAIYPYDAMKYASHLISGDELNELALKMPEAALIYFPQKISTETLNIITFESPRLFLEYFTQIIDSYNEFPEKQFLNCCLADPARALQHVSEFMPEELLRSCLSKDVRNWSSIYSEAGNWIPEDLMLDILNRSPFFLGAFASRLSKDQLWKYCQAAPDSAFEEAKINLLIHDLLWDLARMFPKKAIYHLEYEYYMDNEQLKILEEMVKDQIE